MKCLLNVAPSAPFGFIIFCIGVPLLVRLLVCFYETWRRKIQFWILFCGIKNRLLEPPDYWLPYFLGVIEMAGYSFAFVVDKLTLIGAWLTFKTVHRIGYSKGFNRGPYDRYLLANAILIVGSYLCARFCF